MAVVDSREHPDPSASEIEQQRKMSGGEFGIRVGGSTRFGWMTGPGRAYPGCDFYIWADGTAGVIQFNMNDDED